MNILCISAQKPDSTGSGVYLAETVRAFIEAGHDVTVVAGIDQRDMPDLPRGVVFRPVRFNTHELPFPVCGMSDVMPYESTRYRDMTRGMALRFCAAFREVIRNALLERKPDIVICHHLYLVCSVAAEVLDKLAHDGWGPGWKLDHREWHDRMASVDLLDTSDADPLGDKEARRAVAHMKEGLVRPCPLWAVSHSTDIRQMQSHDLMNSRIIKAVRTLDGVFSLHGQQAAAIVESYGIAPEKVHVIGTGFNAEVFHPISGLRASGRADLLYVGKIWKKKGVESLARCLDLLSVDPARFTLRLAGGYSDEAERDHIAAIAEASRYPVEFLGQLDQEALAKAYNQAHVFVLPSFFEGLPLVAVEALACGCRVVMTDLPGIREWVEREVPGAPIGFVEPPRIVGADEPVEEDLPAFESRLAAAIERSAETAMNELAPSCDVSRLSWDALARRILDVVGLPAADGSPERPGE